MKKLFKNLLLAMTALFVGYAMSACSNDDSEPGNPALDKAVTSLNGLVELDKGMLGDWEEGYVSSKGYILARGLQPVKNPAAVRSLSRSEAGTETSAISYMSVDKSVMVHIFFGDDGLPSQIVIGDVTLYFNFLNDEVLELVLSTASGYKYQTTVNYNRAELLQAIADGNYHYLFQQRLAAIVRLLDGTDIPAEFSDAIAKFREICLLELAENPDATLEDLIDKGLVDQDGNAEFVTEISESYTTVIVKVHYSIMLWTGKASFKVGGTSCTLSGTVHCASESFNDYGTYGIVCDTDIDKLNVDEAEYCGQGHQDGVSTHFDVDFRGLKANTTYYYRAYYRFNSPDHGDLNFRYGDPDAEIAYDTVVKEFTTGDNILTVDVVMCIDVTGSMGGIINTVKANAISFYDSFNKKCVDNGIELAGLNNKVIAFQDINVDGDRWWKESDFFNLPVQKDQFDAFVNTLYADGGGDTAESGLEALDGAFDALKGAVDDGYHRQVVILWTDAPFLSHADYTKLSVAGLADKWDTLSSGRRLILFAPEWNGEYNGGSWTEFDGWKNVIHSTDLSSSFSDFDYILDNIIGELIGKAPAKAPLRKGVRITVHPND